LARSHRGAEAREEGFRGGPQLGRRPPIMEQLAGVSIEQRQQRRQTLPGGDLCAGSVVLGLSVADASCAGRAELGLVLLS